MLMNDGGLGFNLHSIARAGARVGRSAYNVAALPAKAALRVANATSSTLCTGNSGATGQDAQTASAFCRAMKAKDSVNVRRLLPGATAIAAKAAKAQQVYRQAQTAYRDPVAAATQQAVQNASPEAQAAYAAYQQQQQESAMPTAEDGDDSISGFGDQSAYDACYADRRANYDESTKTTRKMCQPYMNKDSYEFGDPEVNLLASLYGANPDDLAFALAGVDPSEIGATFTTNELLGVAPMALAVAAGFWMLVRG